MRKKINGVLYDTETASLIAETESMTALSGKISARLYKSHSGQWFQICTTVSENRRPTVLNWISANTAKHWLEKYRFNLQFRIYFGNSDTWLKSEQQVLVAERKSPNSTYSHDLVQVERLYHHPQKGWCLKQTRESALIPLTANEAASIVKTLHFGEGHIQTPLPSMQTYLYECGHSDHGRI
jgi:hypothetical protein